MHDWSEESWSSDWSLQMNVAIGRSCFASCSAANERVWSACPPMAGLRNNLRDIILPPLSLSRKRLAWTQVHRLRNEQNVYEAQFPERVQLLQNMGFEWEHTAVPDEWELIIMGQWLPVLLPPLLLLLLFAAAIIIVLVAVVQWLLSSLLSWREDN